MDDNMKKIAMKYAVDKDNIMISPCEDDVDSKNFIKVPKQIIKFLRLTVNILYINSIEIFSANIHYKYTEDIFRTNIHDNLCTRICIKLRQFNF